MPVPKRKQGKPLGGIGAQAMSNRRHALVLDDRLLSKQYISTKTDEKVDDTAFSSSWSTDTTTAPSKAALHAKFNALSVNTSAWTQEDSDLSTAKTKTYDSGNVGIGSTLAYSAIDEKLVVDGNIKSIGDLIIGDDASLLSDASILNFGADSDVNLTHVADTGLLLNSSRQLQFGDSGTYIHQSADGVLDLVADTEIELNATTVDINGVADVSGNLAVGGNATITGNTTITGNLTVNGTATSLATEAITLDDNIIVLNSNASGTTDANAGLEIERGDYANVGLRWNGTSNTWQIQSGTDNDSAGTFSDIATAATTHDAITLASNGQNLLSLSDQILTVNDVVVKTAGDAMTGTLDITVAGSSGSCLTIDGGTHDATHAAVSIEGHLEATTKSFNIPHPLLEHKRLVYGSLEGPEHGMYARGSFDVDDERRKVAIDLPMYWSKMVHPDYTVNLTTYGNYNVWISGRNSNGFWVETNSEEEWSFDWNVIGGRRDAKLEVEPDA